MNKWKPYLPGDTIDTAGVHVLQVLYVARSQSETVYNIRCLRCRDMCHMSHATIRGRIYRHRSHCVNCRQQYGNPGTKSPRNLGDKPISPPAWPVPPMLAHIPRGWEA